MVSRPLPLTWAAAETPGSLDGIDAAPAGDAALHLGALDRSGLLSLATLDDEAPPAASGSFAPPEGPPSAGVAQGSPDPGSSRLGSPGSPDTARPDEPLDLFAPHGADAADLVVDLADDELAYRAHMRPVSPAPSPPEPSPPEPATPSGPPMTRRLAPLPQAPRTRLAIERWPPRVRFAAGIFLAIVLGFIPAHVVASVREARASRAFDARVIEAQAAVDSQQSYDALDPVRAAQLGAKHSAHRMIALTSMLIWAAASGAIAYVWFKRVPSSR